MTRPAAGRPAAGREVAGRAPVTRPAGRWAPRWGSVARRGKGFHPLSTGPTLLVLVAGLAFLLGRPALGGVPFAVPLLAAGYLLLTAGALVVGTGERGPRGRAPLGPGVVLAIGLGAVAGASLVGGPVPDRRVGMAAVGLALIAAVAEEALFRGLLYGRLERFGPVVAVLGTAALFALVHLPAYGVAAMPVDLGAAMLLSWQRYACGRWTVPAVTHAVANLLAVT